ncbi:ABC transporter substrate-binding protein [Candidatus Poriferisocius sp.]|uniref:ABC transporter substrate-binding protein n=1 Tax=Candidatus Poriferisocius sp. TaxID=3101276 RepID=UPI003B52C336
MGENLLRIAAAGVIWILVMAGCGSDEGGQPAAPAEPAESREAESQEAGQGNVELVIGSVMPETGSLAFFGPAMIVSIDLAVQDIQAAGGRVRLLTGDSATDPDVAPETVNRLLGEGARVIVGASASGVSQSFIQTLYEAQIPQCAPSNTSTSFSTQANAAYYFRTVPPTQAVALILAEMVASEGATNVALPTRADDWGNSLARLMVENFDELGVGSQILAYDEDAVSFDSIVAAVEDMRADAVVLISFAEGAQIIRGLLEAGLPPAAIYGSDGVYAPNLNELVDPTDPNVIDGLKAITVGGGEEYGLRLGALTGGNVLYGAQAYDCVVVLALASLAAGSVAGPAIIEQVQAVTSGGQKCFDYGECADLIAQGIDIDYDGVSGPLELDEVGDPRYGQYLVAEFIDGVMTVIGSREADLAVYN